MRGMALLVRVVMLGRFMEQACQRSNVHRSVLPFPSRQSRLDLLEQPPVAIRIAERGIGLVGATFRIRAGNTTAGQVEYLTDLDAPVGELLARCVDAVDGKDQALDRARFAGGHALPEGDRAR